MFIISVLYYFFEFCVKLSMDLDFKIMNALEMLLIIVDFQVLFSFVIVLLKAWNVLQMLTKWEGLCRWNWSVNARRTAQQSRLTGKH